MLKKEKADCVSISYGFYYWIAHPDVR